MTTLTIGSPNDVGTQQQLNNDILALETAAPGNYTIAFTKSFSDHAGIPGGAGFGLYAVLLPANVTLTLDGQGFTLDGSGAGLNASGLAVLNGKVTIQDLTIEDTAATGSNGLGAAGGGAGLGGSLFVGNGATVTVHDVTITGASATGGNGGDGGFSAAGGNSSLIFNRDPVAAAFGATGTAGEFGGTDSLINPPMDGGDGGDGGNGGNGAALQAGGHGGHGGAGGGGQTSSTSGPGGLGGKGGNAGNGGAGGFGGTGGNGGFGGGGGDGGHSIHLGPGGTEGGTHGVPGGDGGDGADGGVGGYGAGGGAGGIGGAGGSVETNLGSSGVGGTGGDGGKGGNAATGGFGAGGGGGGNGGDGAEGGSVVGQGGNGGDAGDGGMGGFGGGGGGGGQGGMGGDAGPTMNGSPSDDTTLKGTDGSGGKGGAGGFGAGQGGDGDAGGGGGGGLGAGGDIFVQQGGSLILDGGLLTGGSVKGGSASSGGNPGGMAGSGIFIQGNQTITLAADPGQLLTEADEIADQTGSGGTGSQAGAGTVDIGGTGTVRLTAANHFVGGINLNSGTLELDAAGAAGAGTIAFAAPSELRLNFTAGAVPTNTISGFAQGDTIVVTGFVENGSTYSGELTLFGPGAQVNLNIPGQALADFSITPDATNNLTTITSALVACYAAGTQILTPDGEVPVEALRPGDKVVVVEDGGTRCAPVVWIGYRAVNLTAHPDPGSVAPVRIRRNAFGAGMPHRDLVVSPDHAIFVDGVLIPAKSLLNGTTIVRERGWRRVSYFHVELDRHAVLLAEGLPAESYLDTGDRGAFSNSGGAVALRPEFSAFSREAGSCAPLIITGPELEAVRARVNSGAAIAAPAAQAQRSRAA